jgi:hypothetical protein
MSDFIASSNAPIFRPNPGFNPRGRQERHRRVHFYAVQLAREASTALRDTIVYLRQTNETWRRPFSAQQFQSAVKELVCIWIHLEAIDQGGESMPAWLMNYLKLALNAMDQLIDSPRALDIMKLHQQCTDLDSLYSEVAETILANLGFSEMTNEIASALFPLLANSRAMRQSILRESLLLQQEDDF